MSRRSPQPVPIARVPVEDLFGPVTLFFIGVCASIPLMVLAGLFSVLTFLPGLSFNVVAPGAIGFFSIALLLFSYRIGRWTRRPWTLVPLAVGVLVGPGLFSVLFFEELVIGEALVAALAPALSIVAGGWLGNGRRHFFEDLECPRCGYDLSGTPHQGCPECGWGQMAGRSDDA